MSDSYASPVAKARETSAPDTWNDDDDGEAVTVVRRASYANSPFVGERGQRARQRLLAAGLQVLSEVGYHDANVVRISKASDMSRAAFYQYFSSKEDLFRELSGRVARLLANMTENVDPITADAAGRDALGDWLERYAQLYREYAPVFAAFQTAAASDEAVHSGGARIAVRTFNSLRSRVEGSDLTSRQIDSVIRALPGVVVRVNRMVDLLGAIGVHDGLAAPGRLDSAAADAFHRALFGLLPGVNVHPAPDDGPVLRLPPAAKVDLAAELAGDPSLSAGARRTRDELIESGTQVFRELGYYVSRVDDVVAKAGVSHGIFYRYFKNRKHLFRLIAERASLRLAESFGEIPALSGPNAVEDLPAELRSWLARYEATYAGEATIISMWGEAVSRDAELGAVSVAATETQRVACAEVLALRGYGDIDADALVMIMLLDGMTDRKQTASRIEATAQIMERAFLQPAP